MARSPIDIGLTIKTIPRHDILDGPTPLVPLPRLSERLGIDLWMKRDDLAGPSFGGNKSRQLEYYLGAALAEGADTLLITGAVQSNFVRLAAAVAARFGLEAVVQLESRVAKTDQEYQHSGNVLLNQLLGARILTYPEGEDENGADDALYREAGQLEQKGRKPYVIPLAANKPPLGALGYYRAATEIISQCQQALDGQAFDEVVLASGSGATHLGMVAGMKALSPTTRVIGSCVRRNREMQRERLTRLAELFNAMVGQPEFLTRDDFHLCDHALAPGYGRLGDAAAEAMKMLARDEGYILDPVYTAKAFAVILKRVADGEIAKGSRVLFVHTGGLAALFAYASDIRHHPD